MDIYLLSVQEPNKSTWRARSLYLAFGKQLFAFFATKNVILLFLEELGHVMNKDIETTPRHPRGAPSGSPSSRAPASRPNPGVPTFRGEHGLWRQFRAEDLATPEAFARDPKLVWEWYDWRRGIIAKRRAESGSSDAGQMGNDFLEFRPDHPERGRAPRRAGSKNILELHGNIWNMRCTKEGTIIGKSLSLRLKKIPPRCPNCGALAPARISSGSENPSTRRSSAGLRP